MFSNTMYTGTEYLSSKSNKFHALAILPVRITGDCITCQMHFQHYGSHSANPTFRLLCISFRLISGTLRFIKAKSASTCLNSPNHRGRFIGQDDIVLRLQVANRISNPIFLLNLKHPDLCVLAYTFFWTKIMPRIDPYCSPPETFQDKAIFNYVSIWKNDSHESKQASDFDYANICVTW